MLNKASGFLLFSLECQRHAYYNYNIKPFSSFFFHLTKIVHFYYFRNGFLNAFLNLSRNEKRQVPEGMNCVCG